MCARLLACPLCSQPGFLTLDSLRSELINVATRPLTCPVCNEVLLGMDKLTIHLFSHSISLSNNNTAASSRHINVISSNKNSAAIHNVQNVMFQDWNVPKAHVTECNKIPENNIKTQNSLQSSQDLQNAKNLCSESKSDPSIQDQYELNLESQVTFNQDLVSNNKAVLMIHENKEIEVEKCSQHISHEAIKANYATQYYTNENIKQINFVQNYEEAAHENVQTLKTWLQGQHCEQQNDNIGNGVEKFEQSGKLFNNEQVALLNKLPKITTVYNNMPLETINEKQKQENSSNTCSEAEEIVPQLKLIKTLSTREKTERCNVCGFHFPDHDILLLHKQLVHMSNEDDANIVPEHCLKNYSCHLCSKVFKMRGSLMVHMRVAHMGYHLGSLVKGEQIQLIFNENKYSCPTCGKKFKKEQHVMQHLKTHEAKQWECDVCSKLFTTKYFLKKHKRLHSGEMPYKCNICNKTFTFQQSYHKHRLYHKDDKPHACTTCGRSFKELSTLHNHERIHTGEKPFACETCGKCFRQRVSYLVHRRIHTGVMPYKCNSCGKCFRYKVSQRTHKCPNQQIGNIQQTNTIDQSLHTTNVQGLNNDLCKIQKECSQEEHAMLNVINNEENKYVLIINTEGQHLLTKDTNIGKVETASNKEQELDQHVELNNNNCSGQQNDETHTTWRHDIPDSTIFKKSLETCKALYSKNVRPLHQDSHDFYAMAISPLENGLSSPTTEMEHLRVSSPTEPEDILKSYGAFRNATSALEMHILHSNVEQTFNTVDNNANNLQTINEESLKELLYSINEK